jgi:hypothetical protein
MKIVLTALSLLCAIPTFAQFNVGDSVMVMVGSNSLNARSAPALASTVLRVEVDGTRGRIVGGPQSDPNYKFWQIAWPDVTGWSAEKYLTKALPLVPPPSGGVIHDTIYIDPNSVSVILQGFWGKDTTIIIKKP